MNGKNRRVKGCFSRGMPNFVRLNAPITTPAPPPLPTYNLPVFSNSLTENLNLSQKALTRIFFCALD